MTAIVQLDMFKETTSEDILKAELEALKESHHAVRKKAFGELRALQKIVMDQQEQIDYLKVKLNLACPLPQKL
jgi:bacterioferritin (cytochrome b1)